MDQFQEQPPGHESAENVAEHLTATPDFELIVARHAEYSMDEERPETLGHLTEKGVQQSRELGEQVLEAARSLGGKVDISFIASSQRYDSPDYPMGAGLPDEGGRRAEETSTEAINAILEHDDELQQQGIRVVSPVYEQRPDSLPNDRLVEGDIYYIPFRPGTTDERNENPMGYIKSLRERHGKGWKEAHLRGSDPEAEAVAKAIGAETGRDVAARAKGVIEDVAMLTRQHYETDAGRKRMYVLVAHDGVVRSLLQDELGVAEDSHDYLPAHAESIPIHVKGGVARTDFKGKEYQALITGGE